MSDTLSTYQVHESVVDNYDVTLGQLITDEIELGGFSRVSVFMEHTVHTTLSQVDVVIEVSDDGTHWYYWLDDSNQSISRTKALVGAENWTWVFDNISGNFARLRLNFSGGAPGDSISISSLSAK